MKGMEGNARERKGRIGIEWRGKEVKDMKGSEGKEGKRKGKGTERVRKEVKGS